MEKTEAEAALEEALPALEEARIALSDLEKNDVTEIRHDSQSNGIVLLIYLLYSHADPLLSLQHKCRQYVSALWSLRATKK